MADVFLSYSSKDRAAAEKVQQALAARGYDVFWDQETPPGVDWDTWIRTKLTNAKAAIVLWSKASIASPNVRHEAIVARDANKLIPALIENLTPEDFPMGLYLLQGVVMQDWRNPDSKGMHRLIAEVEARLGSRVPGAAPKVEAPAPRKINWVGVGVGIVLVAAATGLTQWWYSDKTPTRDPTVIDASCPNGLPRMSTGDCPALGTATSIGGGAADSFAARLEGAWTWDASKPCREGPRITIDGDRLEFTTVATSTEPATRFVHQIEADSEQEIRTRVIEPDDAKGEEYSLVPEFVATSDPRGFNLIVNNKTTGERHEWSPCEVE